MTILMSLLVRSFIVVPVMLGITLVFERKMVLFTSLMILMFLVMILNHHMDIPIAPAMAKKLSCFFM